MTCIDLFLSKNQVGGCFTWGCVPQGSPLKKTQQRNREEHRHALEGCRTQKSISKFFSKLHIGIIDDFFTPQVTVTDEFPLRAAERESIRVISPAGVRHEAVLSGDFEEHYEAAPSRLLKDNSSPHLVEWLVTGSHLRPSQDHFL